MRQIGALIVMILIVSSNANAQGSARMKTICQKNLSDGRILVVDGRVIPDNATFKVIKYRPKSRDSVWSTGPCIIAVTRR